MLIINPALTPDLLRKKFQPTLNKQLKWGVGANGKSLDPKQGISNFKREQITEERTGILVKIEIR